MSVIPDPPSIADAFRAFVPEERFRQFLRVLNTTALGKGRLVAWQDFLWARFAAEHPEAPTAFDQIAAALRICPVHLTRMEMMEVPVQPAYWVLPPWLAEARDTLFPFANLPVQRPDSDPGSTALAPVCSDCRQALEDWNASHRVPFGMPRFWSNREWAGDYFVVHDAFAAPKGPSGFVLAGRAGDPDDPWPEVGQTVELHEPDGSRQIAVVLGIDVSITRPCLGDGSAQRAILVGGELLRWPATNTRVRARRQGRESAH